MVVDLIGENKLQQEVDHKSIIHLLEHHDA